MKIPPGIGGRRRRLKSIDEFLINVNKPDLEVTIVPKKVRPTKWDMRKERWRKAWHKFWTGIEDKKGQVVITPESALDMDPEVVLDKMLTQEEAKAAAQNRESVYQKIIPLQLEESGKATRRKKRAEERKQEDAPPFTPGSVGNDQLHRRGKPQPPKAPPLKDGDMLINGAIVRSAVPKSISGPALESVKSMEEDSRKRAETAAREAAAKEREAAIRKTGAIS